MIITLFVCFLWAATCLGFDAFITNKGLRAGIALEGNPLIVAIAGTKPRLWQLLTIDGGLRVALLAFALFTPAPADYPYSWVAFMIGGFTAYGFKNLQGYRQWKWMFNHPGQAMPIPNSAWAQFLGFWG